MYYLYIDNGTLPFIPDGNRPTETTVPNSTTTAPQPNQTAEVVFFDDTESTTRNTSTETTTTTVETTATVVEVTVAETSTEVTESSEVVYTIGAEDETSVTTTSQDETDVDITTASVGSSESTTRQTTTATTSVSGTTEETTIAIDGQTTIETEVITEVAVETSDYPTEEQSNSNYVFLFVGIAVVLLVAGLLLVLPKIKKAK